MKRKRFVKTVVAVTEMRVSSSRGHGLVATDVGGGSTIGVLGSPEATKKHMGMRLDQLGHPYKSLYQLLADFRIFVHISSLERCLRLRGLELA